MMCCARGSTAHALNFVSTLRAGGTGGDDLGRRGEEAGGYPSGLSPTAGKLESTWRRRYGEELEAAVQFPGVSSGGGGGSGRF